MKPYSRLSLNLLVTTGRQWKLLDIPPTRGDNWGYLKQSTRQVPRMARIRDKLNDPKIRKARGKEKAYKLFDGAGMFLLVTPEKQK